MMTGRYGFAFSWGTVLVAPIEYIPTQSAWLHSFKQIRTVTSYNPIQFQCSLNNALIERTFNIRFNNGNFRVSSTPPKDIGHQVTSNEHFFRLSVSLNP